MSTQTIASIWAALIAFAVLAYVMLDGFDLGIGILFAAERGSEDRDTMVNSIAPMWDGNETWLVFGGAGLFAVFPVAYAVILPALYPVIFGMLFGLIFRGVAFELRFRAQTAIGQKLWDLSFFGGSTIAALCQGVTLGGLLQGIHAVNGQYAGGWFDWLTPFTLLCGVAVVTGYAWLGSCWLIWRTDRSLRSRARQQAVVLGWLMLALIVAVSLWTPFLNPTFMHRWFGWPGILFTSPVPVLVALVAIGFHIGIVRQHHLTPFLCALAIFLLCFAGLGISLFPMIVPPDITIWQAAAPRASQLFVLLGAAVLIPLILGYSGFSYWIFRGKVQAGAHYH
ncbi:cytochrome d ubiquinol oxidase subunit II [Rhodopila sp.]|uniref:cytochrome d ubiquinol oxidase subunit II n=1 Tax=Rhodopila sp. TaxID=2480087 RepID=UPI003D102355